MTVVPRAGGVVTLICDGCGSEDSAHHVRPDTDVVWPSIAELGWTGSPFAAGAHRCPRCTLQAPAQPPARQRQDRPRSHGASYAIHITHDIDAAVITPLTDLDRALANRLYADVIGAAHAHRHVVMDLHAVGCIDSAGLRLLVRARQEARHHGTTFNLVRPSRFVHTVLHTMRLHNAFRIFPDQVVALQALRMESRDSNPNVMSEPAG